MGYATGVGYPFERPTERIKIPPYWLDRGMLMTRPFRLECDSLYLNAKVEEGGSIAVEGRKGVDIATPSSPIPVMKQYSRENANLIRNTDVIKIPITFKDADLKPLHGQSIRLLMHLEKATVYGISGE